ncbi:MAG: CheR family methyltransferase [Polyangiaceae bacterium]
MSQPAELARFGGALTRHLGLRFDESKRAVLSDVLRRRLEARGREPEAYLAELEASSVPRDELRALARELTVCETYFFRNHEQFEALAEVVIPSRVARLGSRRLAMLSAGCASGEEPFTMAMLLAERFPSLPSPSIRGADLNPAALEKAARGRYSAWSLRETPPAARQRWFRKVGEAMVLDEALRASVELLERNLVAPDSDLFAPETYDVVFCRNMLMYLTPADMRAVVGRIARSLLPGGYFFLGHAESLRGVSDDFELCQSHGTFYYRRKDHLDARPVPGAPALAEVPSPSPARLAPGDGAAGAGAADAWVAEVQRAHDRVRTLTDDMLAPPHGAAHLPAPLPLERITRSSRPPAAPDLSLAMALLHEERFGSALDLLDTLDRDQARGPEALLLRAVLLNHEGRQQAAEDACRELLARDGRHAAAHYLLALCREALGDVAGAASNHRAAIHIDPRFAMPRLHLGRLAHRQGNNEEARRQLGQAMVLLRREDGARLLLFGGGFRREALVAVCAAELGAVGGKP